MIFSFHLYDSSFTLFFCMSAPNHNDSDLVSTILIVTNPILKAQFRTYLDCNQNYNYLQFFRQLLWKRICFESPFQA